MASLFCCSAASAFWPEATDSSLEVGVGYRNDSIKWKRELRDGSSSFYSGCNGSGESGSSGSRDKFTTDFNWKDISIWFIEGRGRYITCDCIYLRGNVDYGWITSGRLHQKDHFSFASGNNHGFGNDFSSSSNSRGRSSANGFVYDGKIAIGYQFDWCDECLSIAPLVGYSWHGQHLRGGHRDESSNFYGYGFNSDSYCSEESSSSSSSSRSSSSGRGKHRFNDRWNGVFIGFDLDYRLCCEWNLFLNYEYHWAEFHATERKENLFRNDYYGNSSGNNRSSIHANNGYGNVLDFGVEWDLCECWTLGLRAEFQWWYADHGRERTKLCENSIGNVSVEEVVKTSVKHISWDSGSIAVELGMIF
ncbi:MAG: hypothetical protein ACHQUC_00025 [Chlamydiales bacterium]